MGRKWTAERRAKQPRANGWTPERRAKQAAAIQLWKPWKNSTGPVTRAGKARASRNFRANQGQRMIWLNPLNPLKPKSHNK